MKYFKTTLILFSLIFNCSYSFGQSFSLSELIKMSKMDVEGFDTYVTSKGFVFLHDNNDENVTGVTYGLNPSRSANGTADKYITLYSKYFEEFKNCIVYQSTQFQNKTEYSKIKSQIKLLGFIFIESKVVPDLNGANDGISFNKFVYRKGKSEVALYGTSSGFELGFMTYN
jgi:hypothetical protein